jgi:hypothetical protein
MGSTLIRNEGGFALDNASVLVPPPSPAAAYYNQRQIIARYADRLHKLQDIISFSSHLSPIQWTQWFAYAVDYKPDLILELGRASGNSTAAFAQAVYLNQHGRIVSLCLSDIWQKQKVPLLRNLVEHDWFERLDTRTGNMLFEDFRPIIGDAKRILVLWDAHGFEIAALVLGHIMPILADREHMVLMHDISDSRYLDKSLDYNGAELWQGQKWVYATNHHESRLYLGWIDTIVDQSIAIVDFLTRNKGELQSADHSFHQEIGQNPEMIRDMEAEFSKEDWSMIGHWAYFSLNYLPKPYTFPKFARPARMNDVEIQPVYETRTIDLLKVIVRRIANRLRPI